VKKGLAIIFALLLSGCSSDSAKHYYQLPAMIPTAGQPVAVAGAGDNTRPLWVEPVTVPDYLSGNGVAYQTSDVQYVIAVNNLWASPLDQQLQQTLVSYLGQLLPGRLVSGSMTGSSDYDTLSVTVTGFHGRYDGKAVISGAWILQRGDQTLRQPFSLILPQPKDGYPALIRTLAAGWQQEATAIARQITH